MIYINFIIVSYATTCLPGIHNGLQEPKDENDAAVQNCLRGSNFPESARAAALNIRANPANHRERINGVRHAVRTQRGTHFQFYRFAVDRAGIGRCPRQFAARDRESDAIGRFRRGISHLRIGNARRPERLCPQCLKTGGNRRCGIRICRGRRCSASSALRWRCRFAGSLGRHGCRLRGTGARQQAKSRDWPKGRARRNESRASHGANSAPRRPPAKINAPAATESATGRAFRARHRPAAARAVGCGHKGP